MVRRTCEFALKEEYSEGARNVIRTGVVFVGVAPQITVELVYVLMTWTVSGGGFPSFYRVSKISTVIYNW